MNTITPQLEHIERRAAENQYENKWRKNKTMIIAAKNSKHNINID